jgi:hypothetical protein
MYIRCQSYILTLVFEKSVTWWKEMEFIHNFEDAKMFHMFLMNIYPKSNLVGKLFLSFSQPRQFYKIHNQKCITMYVDIIHVNGTFRLFFPLWHLSITS